MNKFAYFYFNQFFIENYPTSYTNTKIHYETNRLLILSLQMFESEYKQAALFLAKFYDNLIAENHSDLRFTLYIFAIVIRYGSVFCM